MIAPNNKAYDVERNGMIRIQDWTKTEKDTTEEKDKDLVCMEMSSR